MQAADFPRQAVALEVCLGKASAEPPARDFAFEDDAAPLQPELCQQMAKPALYRPAPDAAGAEGI
eukprot:2112917-Lingulodinium_polyedra.AAC.1